jgi:hypothetical protein
MARVLWLVLLAGCAVSAERIDASNEAVRSAIMAGAAQDPQARPLLVHAVDQQIWAQQELDLGSNRRAERFLLQAEQNANAATRIARQRQAAAAARTRM